MNGRSPLNWEDRFATHVAGIDEQHRVLFDMFNDARSFLGNKPTREQFEKMVRDLSSYALHHFETEESMMAESHYARVRPDEAARHLEQHRAFADRVASIREDLRHNRLISVDDLVSFLGTWLTNHILNVDLLLGDFLRGANTDA